MAASDQSRTRQAAERVVRGAARTVVAAVDESAHADSVFDFACSHFNRADTEVVFVYVLKPHDARLKSHAAGANEAQSKRYLVDGWVQRAKDLKKEMSCEGCVLTGDAREELLRFCENLRPDALVIGSHGRGALKRAMLGSVSDFMAHHCPCPVIVVRGRKEDAEKGGVYNAFFDAMVKSFRRKQEDAQAEGGAEGGAEEGGKQAEKEPEEGAPAPAPTDAAADPAAAPAADVAAVAAAAPAADVAAAPAAVTPTAAVEVEVK